MVELVYRKLPQVMGQLFIFYCVADWFSSFPVNSTRFFDMNPYRVRERPSTL